MDDVELTQQDYEAADEVLRRNPKDEQYSAIKRRLLAQLHAFCGRRRFRLYYGLRKPRCLYEEWTRQHFHGQITDKQFRSQMKSRAIRPVDQEMIDELFDQVEALILQYSLALQAAAKSMNPRIKAAERKVLEEDATKYFARTKRKFMLDTRELKTVASFLDDVRFESKMGNAVATDYSATNAFFLICIVFDRSALIWKSCIENAHRSQTEPQYLYATTAGKLLSNPQSGQGPPKPQELLTLLMQEKTAAKYVLRQREKQQAQSGTPSSITIPTASIQIQNAQLELTSLQKSLAEAKESKKVALLRVDHWSDLAIGIDEKWKYWALTPVPVPGQQFVKSKAVELPLNGSHWRAILTLFGESRVIETVPLQDVIRAFGKLPPGVSIPQDGRAKPGEINAETISKLKSKMNVAGNSTRKSINLLSSRLGKIIEGPKGPDVAAMSMEDEFVRCRFRVRFLLANEDRTLRFGDPISSIGS